MLLLGRNGRLLSLYLSDCQVCEKRWDLCARDGGLIDSSSSEQLEENWNYATDGATAYNNTFVLKLEFQKSSSLRSSLQVWWLLGAGSKVWLFPCYFFPFLFLRCWLSVSLASCIVPFQGWDTMNGNQSPAYSFFLIFSGDTASSRAILHLDR